LDDINTQVIHIYLIINALLVVSIKNKKSIDTKSINLAHTKILFYFVSVLKLTKMAGTVDPKTKSRFTNYKFDDRIVQVGIFSELYLFTF
jgi:hypothetical protein